MTNKNIIKEFIRFNNLYSSNTNGKNLNYLLEFYQDLNPYWVQDYNRMIDRVRREKTTGSRVNDEIVYMNLPPKYSVRDLKVEETGKDRDLYDEIMLKGRIIQLSNKIAHIFDHEIHDIVDEYLKKYELRYNEETRNKIYNLVSDAFDPKSTEEQRMYASNALVGYDVMVDWIKDERLPMLIEARDHAYSIKDQEICNVHKQAEEWKNVRKRGDVRQVSYGRKLDENGKSLFVMDIDNFGQFSVHMPKHSMTGHIKRRYPMPNYQRNTVVLNDYRNPAFTAFLSDAIEDDEWDEEISNGRRYSEKTLKSLRLVKAIKDIISYSEGEVGISKEQAHELAVKSGLSLRDQKDIDDSEPEY